MAPSVDFEQVVSLHYEPLYRFAYSLARSEADACDLTQQTFYIWATKGGQLRDAAKVKSWLFTTLHREFLSSRRRQVRFPQVELEEANDELPRDLPLAASRFDAAHVVATLMHVDEVYRGPVSLFYLQDFSYQEIADILQVPMGTVKSRLSRGVAQLQNLLARDIAAGEQTQL